MCWRILIISAIIIIIQLLYCVYNRIIWLIIGLSLIDFAANRPLFAVR